MLKAYPLSYKVVHAWVSSHLHPELTGGVSGAR